MKRALLFFASALLATAAHGAQPDTAKPAGAAQPAIARPAMSPQPESAKAARSTQPLGRLFFTPAERVQLDTARIQKKPIQPVAAEAPAAAPPPPEVVTYGGIVRRSDGTAMLWINNQLVDEKEALSALNVKGKVRPDGAVTIQVPDSNSTITVKVGQSFEAQSGKVVETRRLAPEPKGPASDEKSPAAAKQPERAGGEGRAETAP